MFWNWIRARVRDAVLAGVSDAAQELDAEGADPGEAVARLRLRLAPAAALPAPSDEGDQAAGKKRQKAVAGRAD